ncbi:MAG TPA: M23 family metallopeptidase, partial [Patescibacteria group bacterium]
IGANKQVQQEITDQVLNQLSQVKPTAASWQVQISTDEPRIFAQNKDQSFEFVPRLLSPEALQDKASYEISQAGITTIINNPDVQIPLENLDPQKISNEVEQFYKEAFEGAGQPPSGLPPAPPSEPGETGPTPPKPTPPEQQPIAAGQGQKIQPAKEGFKGLSTPQEIATKYLGIPFIGAAFGPAGLVGAAGIGQAMALNKKFRKAEAQLAFLFRPDLKWKKILKDKRNTFLAENLIYKPTKAILEKLLPYDKELYVYRKGGRAIAVEETIFKPFHKFGQGLAANLESRALKTKSAGLSFGFARAARTLNERRRRTSPWGAIGGLIVADLAGGFVESYLTRKALWAMKTVRIANHALKGAASLNTGAGFLLGSAIGGPIGGVIGAGVGASYQVALNITNNKNFLIKGRALAPLRAMQKNPLLRPNLAKGAAVGAILVFGGGPIWLVPLFAGSQYLWGSVRPWAAPWVETKSWNLATKGKYVSLKQFTSSNPIKGRAFASIKHGGYGLAAGAVFAFASGQWYLIPLLALGSFGTSWGIRTGGYYLGRFFSSAGSKVGTKLGVDVASATAKFAGPKLLIAKGLSFFTGIGAVFGIFDLARVVARWGVEQTSVDYETFKKKAWFGEYSRWQWHAYRFFFKAVLAVLNVILWPWDKFWNFIFSTPIFGSILSTFGSWLISGSSFVLRGIGGFFNTVGLGKIGGLFEGAANLISGGAKAIGGAILGFISGVLTLLLGGNVAEAAFSAAIGMVMTGAVLNQAVIGDAFFLDRDVVEESFETQNQFFSVDKAMGIASLGIDASKTITIKNEDLPRDVTIVVQIITRDKPLTNISCRDTATLFAEDGSTFTVFETNGNACPSELGANQTFTFNYPRPQDGSFTLRDENRFEDSTVINRFEMTAATDEGPTPPGSSTASITIGNPPASCPSGWPTQPGNVSQGPFGATSHSRLAQSGELALDIGAGIGTPIISTFDGTVVFAQTSNAKTGYGTQVRIQGNCNDQGFMAIFGHMQAIHASVKEGQPVSRGQLIGWVDHTGYVEPEGPGGSHLHYSFIGLSPMNPPYIPKEVLQNCDNGRGPVCNTTVP